MPEVGREPGWWGRPGLLSVGKMAVGQEDRHRQSIYKGIGSLMQSLEM